jgi:hypothetical protein
MYKYFIEILIVKISRDGYPFILFPKLYSLTLEGLIGPILFISCA